jgi:hypothetical protein
MALCKIKDIQRVNDELVLTVERRVNLKDCSPEFVTDLLNMKEDLVNGTYNTKENHVLIHSIRVDEHNIAIEKTAIEYNHD